MDDLGDLVLDSEELDFDELLAEWDWLLEQGDFTPLMMNAFGDVFLADGDGSVWRLDVEMGELDEVAPSLADFRRELASAQRREEWLSPTLLSVLRSDNVYLGEGECYGFVEPLALGGEPDIHNVDTFDLATHLAERGRLHRELLGQEGTETEAQESWGAIDFADGEELESGLDALEDESEEYAS